MKLLGRVMHIGSKGPVLKSSQTPKLGAPVFNSKKKRIGNIYEIFGPVKNPYIIIKPASGVASESLIGSPIYIGENEPRRRR